MAEFAHPKCCFGGTNSRVEGPEVLTETTVVVVVSDVLYGVVLSG